MDTDRILDKDGKLQDDLIPDRLAINYHCIIKEETYAVPTPPVTYTSFECPRGVFKCGDDIVCCDCEGFTEDKSCPDCERLKALLVDVWNYLNSQTPPDGWWQYEEHLKLESRLKEEKII